MSAFDNFPRASFAGIEFPFEERTITLGIREHQHKYPHTPGAALETLGRELYVVKFRATFQDTFKKYPNLYPSALARLRRAVEQETRDDLVVPGLGTIKALCAGLTQTMRPRDSVSGEKVDLDFIEDIEDAFLINNLIGVSSQSLNSAADNFKLNVNAIRAAFSKEQGVGLFDQITNAVNSVLAVVDTAQAYGNLIDAKLLGAAQLCYQADSRVLLLNDPNNFGMLDALHDLWLALFKLHQDVLKTGGTLQTFLVQRAMSVGEIAKAIYAGDSSRAGEILQLNPFEDPFQIQPGTRVRYYVPAQAQAA